MLTDLPLVAMDPESKQSGYHSASYSAAGSAIMDFQPIKQIHQHLCAFHAYSYVSFVCKSVF